MSGATAVGGAGVDVDGIGGEYWDDVTDPHRVAGHASTWRRFCDTRHRQLLGEWLDRSPFRRALKTDLFDEVTGDGLVPTMTGLASSIHGLDLAVSIPAQASSRHPSLLAVRGDVRSLPYAAGAFDLVVSNSTLDHFPQRTDLVRALAELHRVTATGGVLVITLDNAENPVVRLRASLPLALLRRLHVVPYYVGATLTEGELVTELEHLGFEIRHRQTLMHAPRLPAMVACRVADALGSRRLRSALLRLLGAAERLEHRRLRRWTGYYVAVCAGRSGREDGS